MKRCVCFILVLILTLVAFIAVAQAKSDYSQKEISYIARVVYGEAGHQPFLGKAAVAQVVINRYESGKYGKTVRRVVTARHQFSMARKTSAECIKAVNWAINNRVFPKNLYYFRRSKRKSWYRQMQYYCRIGAHSFFTKGKAAAVTGNMVVNRQGKLITK